MSRIYLILFQDIWQIPLKPEGIKRKNSKDSSVQKCRHSRRSLTKKSTESAYRELLRLRHYPTRTEDSTRVSYPLPIGLLGEIGFKGAGLPRRTYCL